jgi:hypothetical protein
MRLRLSILLVTLITALITPAGGLGQGSGKKGSDEAVQNRAEKLVRPLVNDAVTQLVKDVGEARSKGADAQEQEIRNLVKRDFSHHTQIVLFTLYVTPSVDSNFIKAIEEARVDKQVGSGGESAGSTSLVSKGSVPAILGLAVENGALARTTSGSTVTFRGNPVGIIKALGQNGFIASYDDDDHATRVLRRLSYAVSFDTNRGGQSGTLTGDVQQLSAYSFRLDILNRRDPRNDSYHAKWFDLISKYGRNILNAATDLEPFFDVGDPKADPNLIGWEKAAQDSITAECMTQVKANETKGEAIDAAVREQLAKLRAIPLKPEEDQLVRSIFNNLNSYLLSRTSLLETVANGAIVTFEYINNRQIGAPNLSNFNLVAEDTFFRGKADLTANASLTILDKIPAGMNLKRVRDFNVSAQADIPVGEVQKIGSIVFTLSGMYKRMLDNAIMPGSMMVAQAGGVMPGMVVPNTRGDIGIGQLKLTIPVKGSGVKIPLSITFANRTELIKESEVRGNVGVTFDLDSIFATLKP